MKYCSNCGHEVHLAIPVGDDKERYCCSNCGTIHYENPRMVVGCIPEWQDKVLLCLRDIEPRRNTWTLPAGYLENGESVQDGARRETWEESRARVSQLTPYFLGDLVGVDQLYLMFRCQLDHPEFAPTMESSEVKLFREADIPWNNISFPVIKTTLKYYFADRAAGKYLFRNEIVDIRLDRF